MQVKIIKTLTLPVIKLEKAAAVIVKLTGPMYVGKKIGDKEPATLLNAERINIETGETMEGLLVVSSMLKSNLNESYPDQSYVGKTFQLVNNGKRAGKNGEYNDISVYEVVLETSEKKGK